MKKLTFKKDIHADAKKVYDIMLGITNINTYRQWTTGFDPTSTYEGSWGKGSKILFIGLDENGKRGGMVSEIADNVPNKFVSIRHKGMLDGDNEITSGPEVEKWAGGLENYSFEENNGVTTVSIEIDVTEEHADSFQKMWPEALDKLQEIVENTNA